MVIGCWYLVVGNIVATNRQPNTNNQQPNTNNQTVIYIPAFINLY